MDWKEFMVGYGIALLITILIWYLLSFYKKRVIIRWVIQISIFFVLSATIIPLSIIIFLIKTEPMNVFWFGVLFRIGFYLFLAFLASIYFLITRGIVFPKRKKRDYESLKKAGVEPWMVNILLKKYDE
jgi:hypothetical protein